MGGGAGVPVAATWLATTGGGGTGSVLAWAAAVRGLVGDPFAVDPFAGADIGLPGLTLADDGFVISAASGCPAGDSPFDPHFSGSVGAAGGLAVATAANVAALAVSAARAFGFAERSAVESSPVRAKGKSPGILPAADHL